MTAPYYVVQSYLFFCTALVFTYTLRKRKFAATSPSHLLFNTNTFSVLGVLLFCGDIIIVMALIKLFCYLLRYENCHDDDDDRPCFLGLIAILPLQLGSIFTKQMHDYDHEKKL